MEMDNKPLATLIHISDLHFCDKFTNDETQFKKLLYNLPFIKGTFAHSYQAARALSIRINHIRKDREDNGIPCGVVFTGDLTSSGKVGQLDIGFKYLREAHFVRAGGAVGLNLCPNISNIDFNLTPKLFYVPGNHDIWGSGNPEAVGALLNLFPGPYPKRWQLKTKSRPVYLYGLNSTPTSPLRHLMGRGRLQENELEIFRLSENYPDFRLADDWQKGIHIIFLHHPIIEPNPHQWDISMKLDERENIAEIFNNFADLVLAGHYHYEYHADRNKHSPNNAIAGSATQLFSENRNFLLFDIYDNKIILTVFEYDNEALEFVYNEEKCHTFNIREYVEYVKYGKPKYSCPPYTVNKNGDIVDENGRVVFSGKINS